MIKKITTTVLFVFAGLLVFSQTNADVVGEWYNAEKDAVITLFEDGQTVSGKITWMKFPNDENGNPKTDPLNPDEKLRTRARIGMVMMSGFSHIAGKVWDNGKLYNPKKGETYSGLMTLKDVNTLDLTGYIGFSFIKRSSSTWIRDLDEDLLRKEVRLEKILIQLREDLNKVLETIENVSLKPAKKVIKKIEKEKLLLQLEEDLKRIIKEIEEIKKTE